MIKVQEEPVVLVETTEPEGDALFNEKPFDAVKSRILRQIEEEMLDASANLEANFTWHGSYVKADE